jgi:multiple sugar transport system substrate-binding protein
MKKLLLTVLAGFLLLSLLVGCGGGNNPVPQGESQSTAQPESSAPEKVKIVVWGAVPAENGPQDVCDQFMKQNGDIEVEYVRYVNDDQGNVKLDSALMSGEQIDAYFTYFEDLYVKRIASGAAEDLTPWLKEDNFDIRENYGDGVWLYNNAAYGLPTNYDFQFVFANTKMFEELGIPLPTEWTWDEYAEITKKLTRDVDGVHVFGGFMNWQDVGRYIGRGQVLGADSFYKSDTETNFDNPIYQKALTLFDKLMLKDKSHLNFVESGNAKLQPYGELLTGKAATCISAPWIIRYINDSEKYPHDFKVAALPLPKMPGESANYGWPGQTSVIMMNSKSEYKDQAYRFIKYFGSEGQEYMCRAGKIPSWKGLSQDLAIQNLLGKDAEKNFDVQSFKDVLFTDKVKPFYNTKFKSLPEIERIWKEEVEKFVSGNQSIEEALDAAKQKGDRVLQQ